MPYLWRLTKDIINLLKHYNSIILRVIDYENERHDMNKGSMKTHEWEIRVLVFRIFPSWKYVFDIDTKFITKVIFEYFMLWGKSPAIVNSWTVIDWFRTWRPLWCQSKQMVIEKLNASIQEIFGIHWLNCYCWLKFIKSKVYCYHSLSSNGCFLAYIFFYGSLESHNLDAIIIFPLNYRCCPF